MCTIMCTKMCKFLCKFFFFLCKICAHFLHISNLHSVFRPREDTNRYLKNMVEFPKYLAVSWESRKLIMLYARSNCTTVWVCGFILVWTIYLGLFPIIQNSIFLQNAQAAKKIIKRFPDFNSLRCIKNQNTYLVPICTLSA